MSNSYKLISAIKSKENSKVDELIRKMNAKEINKKVHYDIALNVACLKGNNEAVDLLLAKSGTDVNVEGDGGRRPLHSAIVGNNLEAISKLLAMPNIDVNARTGGGSTPLQVACHMNKDLIVKKLLAFPGIDTRDKNGKELKEEYLKMIKKSKKKVDKEFMAVNAAKIKVENEAALETDKRAEEVVTVAGAAKVKVASEAALEVDKGKDFGSINDYGIGRKLLEKSGWKDGQSLGIRGDGLKVALDGRDFGQHGRFGLGFEDHLPDKRDLKEKKKMAEKKERAALEKNIAEKIKRVALEKNVAEEKERAALEKKNVAEEMERAALENENEAEEAKTSEFGKSLKNIKDKIVVTEEKDVENEEVDKGDMEEINSAQKTVEEMEAKVEKELENLKKLKNIDKDPKEKAKRNEESVNLESSKEERMENGNIGKREAKHNGVGKSGTSLVNRMEHAEDDIILDTRKINGKLPSKNSYADEDEEISLDGKRVSKKDHDVDEKVVIKRNDKGTESLNTKESRSNQSSGSINDIGEVSDEEDQKFRANKDVKDEFTRKSRKEHLANENPVVKVEIVEDVLEHDIKRLPHLDKLDAGMLIEVAAAFPLSEAQRGESVAPSLNLIQSPIKAAEGLNKSVRENELEEEDVIDEVFVARKGLDVYKDKLPNCHCQFDPGISCNQQGELKLLRTMPQSAVEHRRNSAQLRGGSARRARSWSPSGAVRECTSI